MNRARAGAGGSVNRAAAAADEPANGATAFSTAEPQHTGNSLEEEAGKLVQCAAPTEKGNYVYILQCRDGILYTGWTTDLPARLAAHNGEKGCGAKCTRGRRPVRLVYYEAFEMKNEAMSREAAIKKLTRAKKLELIAAERNLG